MNVMLPGQKKHRAAELGRQLSNHCPSRAIPSRVPSSRPATSQLLQGEDSAVSGWPVPMLHHPYSQNQCFQLFGQYTLYSCLCLLFCHWAPLKSSEWKNCSVRPSESGLMAIQHGTKVVLSVH